MFGKRGGTSVAPRIDPQPSQAPAAREAAPAVRPAATPAAPPRFEAGAQLSATTTTVSSPSIAPAAPPPPVMSNQRSESFYETKGQIFGALIEAIDLSQLAKLDPMAAREEIRDIVNEIISIKNVVM